MYRLRGEWHIWKAKIRTSHQNEIAGPQRFNVDHTVVGHGQYDSQINSAVQKSGGQRG